jgi:hypothetical protein
MIGFHQPCEKGDRRACVRFGILIGRNQQRDADWRRAHADWVVVGKITPHDKGPPSRRPLYASVFSVSDLSSFYGAEPKTAQSNIRAQRVLNRPFMPPGTGAGSVASRSTRSTTSERCEGESLMNAFRSRRPWIVSLDGHPSFSLNSETDVRFFISRP